ncbi:MAG: hypothetical protein LBS19_05945 [Clostridiales bacterium]|jgi:hypothetical protein|nr:hypothetical protein [Clostridiales bacterium]
MAFVRRGIIDAPQLVRNADFGASEPAQNRAYLSRALQPPHHYNINKS